MRPMGSLRFDLGHTQERKWGSMASECMFWDKDEKAVLAFLDLDRNGQLFELDIFKSDFSPSLRWPTYEELVDANP